MEIEAILAIQTLSGRAFLAMLDRAFLAIPGLICVDRGRAFCIAIALENDSVIRASVALARRERARRTMALTFWIR